MADKSNSSKNSIKTLSPHSIKTYNKNKTNSSKHSLKDINPKPNKSTPTLSNNYKSNKTKSKKSKNKTISYNKNYLKLKINSTQPILKSYHYKLNSKNYINKNYKLKLYTLDTINNYKHSKTHLIPGNKS